MVSLKNILTIGAIIAAGVAFIQLGGASGIGARIGGGFGSFGSSLTAGIAGSLNPFSGLSQSTVKDEPVDNGRIGPDPRTGTEAFDPLGNLSGNLTGLQNLLDSFNNFVTSGGAPPVTPTPSGVDVSFSRREPNPFIPKTIQSIPPATITQTRTGFIGPLPTTQSLIAAGFNAVTRPVTLTQIARGTSTTFAVPPAINRESLTGGFLG